MFEKVNISKEEERSYMIGKICRFVDESLSNYSMDYVIMFPLLTIDKMNLFAINSDKKVFDCNCSSLVSLEAYEDEELDYMLSMLETDSYSIKEFKEIRSDFFVRKSRLFSVFSPNIYQSEEWYEACKHNVDEKTADLFKTIISALNENKYIRRHIIHYCPCDSKSGCVYSAINIWEDKIRIWMDGKEGCKEVLEYDASVELIKKNPLYFTDASFMYQYTNTAPSGGYDIYFTDDITLKMKELAKSGDIIFPIRIKVD